LRTYSKGGRFVESLGKYLKAERESRNLSLKQVSESTRIKERLLKAIEEDQYELLSSHVYVKGFLDAYARYLELDPNDIVLRYQKYHGSDVFLKAEPKQQLLIASKPGRWLSLSKKRAKVWFYVALVSLIILLIAIFLYYFYF
jgi:cytoskeletal protein RodZ